MDDPQARITDELRSIRPLVEELTGLPSRWNGIVKLVTNAEFKGLKPFSCTILLDDALAQQDKRWSTLIHESLHACSAGYQREDFQNFRGWEEGVVEKLQRLWRPIILSRLSVPVADTLFDDLDRYHYFNPYLNALEEIRQALIAERVVIEPEAFYKNLITVPIRDRPSYILRLGYQQTGLPHAPFVRALSAANAVLTRRPL